MCGEVKPLSEFHLLTKSSDGRQGRCKICACKLTRDWTRRNKERLKLVSKAYYEANKERLLKRNKEWVKRNPERALEFGKKYRSNNSDKECARARKYRQANAEALRESSKRYHEKNPEAKATWDAARRAQRRRAMPPWADTNAIKAFYRAAKQRTKETGTVWHVDHIIPLQHELVCGLHIPANLQLLPAVENTKKHNHFTP